MMELRSSKRQRKLERAERSEDVQGGGTGFVTLGSDPTSSLDCLDACNLEGFKATGQLSNQECGYSYSPFEAFTNLNTDEMVSDQQAASSVMLSDWHAASGHTPQKSPPAASHMTTLYQFQSTVAPTSHEAVSRSQLPVGTDDCHIQRNPRVPLLTPHHGPQAMYCAPVSTPNTTAAAQMQPHSYTPPVPCRINMVGTKPSHPRIVIAPAFPPSGACNSGDATKLAAGPTAASRSTPSTLGASSHGPPPRPSAPRPPSQPHARMPPPGGSGGGSGPPSIDHTARAPTIHPLAALGALQVLILRGRDLQLMRNTHVRDLGAALGMLLDYFVGNGVPIDNVVAGNLAEARAKVDALHQELATAADKLQQLEQQANRTRPRGA